MTATTTARFKVLGIDRDCDTCECCGKTNLKLTVILGRLDADRNVAETLRFGRDCAARATRLCRTAAAMEKIAQEAQRAADEAYTARVVFISDSAVCDWVVEMVGGNGAKVERLCFVRGTRTEAARFAERRYPNFEINIRKVVGGSGKVQGPTVSE